MYLDPMVRDLARVRCAERERQSLENWRIAQALAASRRPARPTRRLALLLRRMALRAAWRLIRFAGADSGPYTVREPATLVDARGAIRTVCPDEIDVVLLPRTNRDAA